MRSIQNKHQLDIENKYLEYSGTRSRAGFFGIAAVIVFTAFVFLMLFVLIGKIFVEGTEVLSWQFLISAPRNNMTEGGIGPAIFGTFAVTLLMIIFSVPIGVFSAIYLCEYAADNFLSKIIRLSVNNLAGVPSIVFGLFGLGFFILIVGKGLDDLLNTGLLFGQPAMLWAAATLAVLVLPTIIVSTISALNSVPQSQREAAYGLGATKWQTIRSVVLPQAKPGIMTGIILSISRGAGETAPVLFLGAAFFLPNLPLAELNFGFFSVPMVNPFEQFMFLSYHIFILATQSSNPTATLPMQYGTTLVLLFLTIALNMTAIIFRFKFRKTLENVRGIQQ